MAESLSRVPLLSGDTAEQADLSISALAQAYGALQAGKMPTSDQLDRMVRKLLSSSLLQPDIGGMLSGKVGGGKLSTRGRNLVVQERRVIQAIARLVLEKNQDDKIQRFIWAARHADIDVDADVDVNVKIPKPAVPSASELGDAGKSLHELVSLLLTSSELRNLLADSLNLFRDVFADALEESAEGTIALTRASKRAAKKVRPSEDQKKAHKTGLEADHWEDVLGNAQDVRKSIRRGAEDKRDDMLRQTVKKGRELKHYVDEKLPTDVKDAVIERWRDIANEIQRKPEYKDAVNTLYGLWRKYADQWVSELKEAAEKSTAKLKDVEAEPNEKAEDAVSLLREIIESFTGPLDGAFQAGDKLYKHVRDDERIQQIWSEFETLFERSINDPGYVTSNRASRQFDSLYDRSREVVESNADWKRDANAFADEARKLLDNAANDRALEAVGDAFEDLGDAISEFGKTGYNLVGVDGGDLWKDVSTVFLPRILGALKQVPMPRVEFTSEDVDLIVDNVNFESASFIPDAAHFRSNVEFSTQKGYAAYASDFKARTTLAFAGLRMQATNISYYVNVKKHWLGLEDSGMLDVYLGSANDPKADNGVDCTLVVSNATEDDRESFFKLEKVDVSIEGFNLRIRQSQSPVRAWFAQTAVRGFLEAKIKEALEEQFASAFQALDKQLYDLHIKSLGASGAAADPIAYFRGIFNTGYSSPLSPSFITEVSKTGIQKVGPRGEWVLAIGVEEELLPGKRTLLGRKGEDVVSRKRQVESLAEEGRAELVGAAQEAGASSDNLEQVGQEVSANLDEAAQEARHQARREAHRRKREELRREGWKSDAFDLIA
ncbi:Proteophosphoglycan ppg4 [Rhodotorula sp. JG-1b]|nr:Proteophosphoglycan ppg4 [Rhodotorula sp. JG-1b]